MVGIDCPVGRLNILEMEEKDHLNQYYTTSGLVLNLNSILQIFQDVFPHHSCHYLAQLGC